MWSGKSGSHLVFGQWLGDPCFQRGQSVLVGSRDSSPVVPGPVAWRWATPEQCWPGSDLRATYVIGGFWCLLVQVTRRYKKVTLILFICVSIG